MKIKYFSQGLNDILEVLKNIDVLFYLSKSDLYARYKSSILGPLWITFGTFIFIFGLGFLWSKLFHKNLSEFIPSITIGILIWQIISTSIVESTNIFNNKASIIKNIKMPLFIFPAQIVIKQLINFCHNIIIYILIFFIFNIKLTSSFLFFIPMFLIFIINMMWITLMFSIIGARFRDFHFVINALMPLIFFMTPVIYQANDLGYFSKIIKINPLTHFIETIRAPLMGDEISLMSTAFCFGFAVIGWILTLSFFNKTRNNIVFWI